MLSNKFFFKLFILLFLLYGQTSVAKNFININSDDFCSSNEEANNVDHCNLCLISELDYFKNNKYYSDLLNFSEKKITHLKHFLAIVLKYFQNQTLPQIKILKI